VSCMDRTDETDVTIVMIENSTERRLGKKDEEELRYERKATRQGVIRIIRL
jgi:hypothetical protein